MYEFLSSPKVLIAIIVVVIAAAAAYDYHDARNWDKFAAEHDCHVVAKHAPTTAIGVTANGNMGTIVTNGTTSYTCNNGVTYTR